MSRILRAAATLFVALSSVTAVSACGDDSSGPDSNPVAGTYVLQSVNGQVLPAEVVAGYTIVAERLTLHTDNTFADVLSDRVGTGPVRTDTLLGTYTYANNAVLLNYSVGSSENAAISGNTLTILHSTGAWVFRR
jgi:hypothetical protein